MAHYKYVDTDPHFKTIDPAQQLLPETFEHALHHLRGHVVDLSHFDARVRNEATGIAAFPPTMPREHVTFIALTGDPPPHFTTTALG